MHVNLKPLCVLVDGYRPFGETYFPHLWVLRASTLKMEGICFSETLVPIYSSHSVTTHETAMCVGCFAEDLS
jgi:hypothetical protein